MDTTNTSDELAPSPMIPTHPQSSSPTPHLPTLSLEVPPTGMHTAVIVARVIGHTDFGDRDVTSTSNTYDEETADIDQVDAELTMVEDDIDAADEKMPDGQSNPEDARLRVACADERPSDSVKSVAPSYPGDVSTLTHQHADTALPHQSTQSVAAEGVVGSSASGPSTPHPTLAEDIPPIPKFDSVALSANTHFDTPVPDPIISRTNDSLVFGMPLDESTVDAQHEGTEVRTVRPLPSRRKGQANVGTLTALHLSGPSSAPFTSSPPGPAPHAPPDGRSSLDELPGCMDCPPDEEGRPPHPAHTCSWAYPVLPAHVKAENIRRRQERALEIGGLDILFDKYGMLPTVSVCLRCGATGHDVPECKKAKSDPLTQEPTPQPRHVTAQRGHFWLPAPPSYRHHPIFPSLGETVFYNGWSADAFGRAKAAQAERDARGGYVGASQGRGGGQGGRGGGYSGVYDGGQVGAYGGGHGGGHGGRARGGFYGGSGNRGRGRGGKNYRGR